MNEWSFSNIIPYKSPLFLSNIDISIKLNESSDTFLFINQLSSILFYIYSNTYSTIFYYDFLAGSSANRIYIISLLILPSSFYILS